MIYLKRLLFLFTWLLNIVFIILPCIFILFITYPFYLIVYYVAYGEVGENINDLYDKSLIKIYKLIDNIIAKFKKL